MPCSDPVKQKIAQHNSYIRHKDKVMLRTRCNRTRRRLELQEYKTKQGCLFCNEKTAICLEFHHIDPATKLMGVNDAVKRAGEKAIWDEVKKCVVLCSNCHKKLHAGLLAMPVVDSKPTI